MVDALLRFVHRLRGHGLAISPAETLDAVRAMADTGCDVPDTLRWALASTLVKRHTDLPVFERCFDEFFKAPSLLHTKAVTASDSLQAMPDAANKTAEASITETPVGTLAADILAGRNDRLMMALARSAREPSLMAMQFMTQRGLYARRLLQGAGVMQLEADIARLSQSESETDRAAIPALNAGLDSLQKLAHDWSVQTLRAQGEPARRMLMEERVLQGDWNRLTFEEALPLIQRLTRQLVARQHRRRQNGHHERLDVRNSLRAALATDGILLALHWRDRRPDRARVRVLCDVSGSVRHASMFLLTLIHGLGEVIDDLRSFVFSGSLGEVTDWFRTLPPPEAVSRIRETYADRGTDHGEAFKAFLEATGHDIDRSTTVIILGDARNNSMPMPLDALRHLKRRARHVVWLNPESRLRWGQGDSAMPACVPYLSAAHACKTLADLARISRTLLDAHQTR